MPTTEASEPFRCWDAAQADLLERAIGVAATAHRGQRYPSSDEEPYILHALRVMSAVEGPPAKVGAVLHDVDDVIERIRRYEAAIAQLGGASSRRMAEEAPTQS
jgi:(p)ppGpp synthase/HD superfamily hydrolase